jgi:hypothetical protein
VQCFTSAVAASCCVCYLAAVIAAFVTLLLSLLRLLPCCLQRYGPPPSYPNLKIPGLNAPIPPGASFGYHGGGWGKPPVDAHGNPIYGDVFGLAQVGRCCFSLGRCCVFTVFWASGPRFLCMRVATPSVETCSAWHRWADSCALTVLACVVGRVATAPVDAHGNPIYGDVFGLAQLGR